LFVVVGKQRKELIDKKIKNLKKFKNKDSPAKSFVCVPKFLKDGQQITL